MDVKKRSSNFTSSEKIHLFGLIADKYASILEDKKTDRASIWKREEAWKSIEKEFNAASPASIYRQADTLKKLYSNKKKRLRKRWLKRKKKYY